MEEAATIQHKIDSMVLDLRSLYYWLVGGIDIKNISTTTCNHDQKLLLRFLNIELAELISRVEGLITLLQDAADSYDDPLKLEYLITNYGVK